MPPGKTTGLDLTKAWDNDYATDKITLHLQRLYLSIVLGLANLGKHISRLRSWKETYRTATFCIISTIGRLKNKKNIQLILALDILCGMVF